MSVTGESPLSDEIPRIDLESQKPTDERIEALRVQFPDVFADGQVDFDALKRSLGEWIDPSPERFGLTWPGKAGCMRVIKEPSIGTLVPVIEESVEWETTQNVLIDGENLEVLKLLQKAYYGKVKLIYIDPPYNTGKEFIYPDNFKEGLADYLRYSGQVDEKGFKLSANVESDGRYHSKWLSMMYPRLFLARNLLREDGVIFVSIDDHEVHHLRVLMNEIFGEENFIATLAVQLNPRGRNLNQFVAQTHEYVMVFARDASTEAMFGLKKDDRMSSEYRHEDERGAYREIELRNRNPRFNSRTRPGLYYPIFVDPDTGRVSADKDSTHSVMVYPADSEGRESCWTWSPDRLRLRLDHVHARQVGNGWRIFRRDYLYDAEGNIAETLPKSLWTDRSLNNDLGKKAVRELLGEVEFDFPKSPDLIRQIVRLGARDGDIVLDFFGGSGTTAEAVLRQDLEDGWQRPYILVQLPEPIASTESATERTLSTHMKDRVRAASLDVQGAQPQLGKSGPDCGFRAFKLAQSNFTVWESSAGSEEQLADQLSLSADHVSEERGEASILTELLLKAGFSLTVPVEAVDFAALDGYSVADGALLVCLSRELTIEAFEAMAELDPAMILVLDAGFGGNDELKVNALQTVRARNQKRGSDIALRVA